MKIRIGDKLIGDGVPSFIIAEAGINHNGSVKIAKKLIHKAKDSGADAIKFQTFQASELCSTKLKFFKQLKKLELNEHEFGELSDTAKQVGIIFLSTPFSISAVDLLSKLGVPGFKIASGDLTDLPLIKYAACLNKPMIVSTGMANLNEISDAVKTIKAVGNKKIMLLHCSSSYPTSFDEANLKAIKTLKEKYKVPVGYSDNGDGFLVPLIAVALGAQLIEKHFTLNKKLKGPDHKFSLNPHELKNLIQKVRQVEKMLGDGIKKPQSSERKNLINGRRSITAKLFIKKSTKITRNMVTMKRPATGITPKDLYKVIGKIAKKNIPFDESIKWRHLR